MQGASDPQAKTASAAPADFNLRSRAKAKEFKTMSRRILWTGVFAVIFTAIGLGAVAGLRHYVPRLAPGDRCIVVGDQPDATTAPMRDKASGRFADADGYDRGFVIGVGETVTVLSDAEDSVLDANRWVRIAHPNPKGGWKVPAVRRCNLAPIR